MKSNRLAKLFRSFKDLKTAIGTIYCQFANKIYQPIVDNFLFAVVYNDLK